MIRLFQKFVKSRHYVGTLNCTSTDFKKIREMKVVICTRDSTKVLKASLSLKLGTVDVSPKRIRDMAEQNVYNNTKYRVIGNNCQDWVEWLLCEIDPELARAMYEKGVRKVSETYFGHVAKQNKSWTDALPSSLGSSMSSSKRKENSFVPRYRRIGKGQIQIQHQQ